MEQIDEKTNYWKYLPHFSYLQICVSLHFPSSIQFESPDMGEASCQVRFKSSGLIGNSLCCQGSQIAWKGSSNRPASKSSQAQGNTTNLNVSNMEVKLMTFKLNMLYLPTLKKIFIMIWESRYIFTSLRFLGVTARNMVAFRECEMGLQSIRGSFLPHEGPHASADTLAYSRKLCPLLSSMYILSILLREGPEEEASTGLPVGSGNSGKEILESWVPGVWSRRGGVGDR